MAEGARLAAPADLLAVVEVATAFAATLPDQRGGSLLLANEALSGSIKARLNLAINCAATAGHGSSHAVTDGNEFLLVGTYDEFVFGYALLGMRRLGSDILVGDLHHFLVAEDARKVGIGESMMNLALEIFSENGCDGIESRALPGDRHTKNFFESFGLKARLLTVHRAL